MANRPHSIRQLSSQFARLRSDLREFQARTLTEFEADKLIHLANALSRTEPLLAQANNPEGLTARAQRDIAQGILEAQVDADTFHHPGIDPNDGWVLEELCEDGTLLIDTQLMRLVLDSAGRVLSMGYKPRKFELVPVCGEAAEGWSLPASLAGEGKIAPPRILKKHPGLLTVRFDEGVRGENSEALVFAKELTVKAGIGAYLNDATTGLSLELYAERGIPEQLLAKTLVVSWSIMLPSSDIRLISLSPLRCFGGVGEARIGISELDLLGAECPGGLYGVRLIDGLDDFTLDLRTSRALTALKARHVWRGGETTPDSYLGLSLEFHLLYEEVSSDLRATTFFLSIV